MCQTFIQPSGESVLVLHIENVIELSVRQMIDTGSHEEIKLHITSSLLGSRKPILPTRDEECREDSRLHDGFPVDGLDADIRQIADFQCLDQIGFIDVMSTLFQLFFHLMESKLYAGPIIEIHPSETITGNFPQGLFDQFLSRPRVVLHLLPIGIHQACGTHVQQIGVAFMHELTFEDRQVLATFPHGCHDFVVGEILRHRVIQFDGIRITLLIRQERLKQGQLSWLCSL